uniref:Uncharacterized protein n=1 Tax=Nelumbo nucifera TaxID=4432 RepID=A0A822ZK44_NELNU|nr:TPA_asm: hypothetical protein HUJ06_001616 [Nelumbo nucifera]
MFILFYKKRRCLIMHANAKNKSKNFPTPHQDGAFSFHLGDGLVFYPLDVPFNFRAFTHSKRLV